jgi:hypothetical protein
LNVVTTPLSQVGDRVVWLRERVGGGGSGGPKWKHCGSLTVDEASFVEKSATFV